MRRMRASPRSQEALEQERCPESFSFGAQGTPGCGHPMPSVAAWRRAHLPGVPGRLSCRLGHFSEGMVLAVNSELSGDPQVPAVQVSLGGYILHPFLTSESWCMAARLVISKLLI